MTTPQLHMQTLFRLDAEGRIACTREPASMRGPVFWLARGRIDCAWTVRRDTPTHIALELANLARDEPVGTEFRAPPAHERRYRSLVEGEVISGPAFHFPASITEQVGVDFVNDVDRLLPHFPGWREDEVVGRMPIAAVEQNGRAVSVCCCARSSAQAAEAGLETASEFRGRGLAARVTSAWALAVRASGRTPLYSTSWDNRESLAVARKLGLNIYASTWSINDGVSREPSRAARGN